MLVSDSPFRPTLAGSPDVWRPATGNDDCRVKRRRVASAPARRKTPWHQKNQVTRTPRPLGTGQRRTNFKEWASPRRRCAQSACSGVFFLDLEARSVSEGAAPNHRDQQFSLAHASGYQKYTPQHGTGTLPVLFLPTRSASGRTTNQRSPAPLPRSRFGLVNERTLQRTTGIVPVLFIPARSASEGERLTSA